METPTPVVETPAPAPTISAEQDASNRRDFNAFEEASEATRKGTPKARVTAPVETPKVEPEAPVETPAEPVAAAPVTPPVSKRQEDINNRIREAVERARAEDKAEIARLRGAAPREPEKPAEPEWKRLATLPDAPKLADFESVEEHSAAMALFIVNARDRERGQQHLSQQRETYNADRISRFDTRVTELEKTEPGVTAEILPVAQELASRGGPYAIIARESLDSEMGPQLLRHFKANPDYLEQLAILPPHLRGLPPHVAVREHDKLIVKALGKLEVSLERPAVPAPASPAPSTVSTAPPPAPQLSRTGVSSDPQAAALARRDFTAWEKHETAKDLARRGAA